MNQYDSSGLSENLQINDEIYDGKSVFDLVRERIISPNIEWTPPIYHPFSLDELVCVHITDQEVEDGFLKPHSYHPYVPPYEEGKKWFFPRETLHFALNGAVATHCGGDPYSRPNSWEQRKFAYIIPLQEIMDNVVCLFTHDTIALGKIKLPDSTVIITEQSDEKITNEIRRLGYQPLQISGCQTFDPAVIQWTNVNINHVINFQRIIGDYGIDGPYPTITIKDLLTSLNNILVLDQFLMGVCEYVSRGNAYYKFDYPGIIENMRDRVEYLKNRWGKDPNKVEAIRRLDKGSLKYVSLIQKLKEEKQFSQQNKLMESILWNEEGN